MSRQELETLLGAGIEFAKRMIQSHGEFHPFGVKLASDGAVDLVGIHTGEEFPKGAPLVDDLQRTFQDLATEGKIRAAAVCFVAEVLLKDRTSKQTAVVFRLAHQNGEVAEVVLPFAISESAAPDYGELVALAPRAFSLRTA